MRILIVEDDYLLASSVAETLESAGCTVAGVAATVTKALHILDEQVCDAALLDANLDGESAEPVAVACRLRGIPFLVVSGYTTEQLTGVLASGPFLAKPCKARAIVAAVMGMKM